MQKTWIRILVACVGLAVMPTWAGAAGFSATRTVIAILADDLFVGEAEGHLDGTGTLALRSQKDPALTCVGQFTSSVAQGGSGQMQCSNGVTATFQFTRLTVFTGHGAGTFNGRGMSFVYGLGRAEAAAFLQIPDGKKLTQNGAVLALADR